MFDTLIERIMSWARIQSGIERLQGLDDRLLADMGIERELIPQISRTGIVVAHATLVDEASRPAVVAASTARPPSLGRKGSECSTVPSMS